MKRPWEVEVGDPLTEREMTILLAMADGDSNVEIAKEIHLSVESIKGYVKTLLKKLGAKNRTHAVALAYHRSLLVPRKSP